MVRHSDNAPPSLILYLFPPSRHMETAAKKVLVQDLEEFVKLDIVTKLWKLGHYPIIETLRPKSKYK